MQILLVQFNYFLVRHHELVIGFQKGIYITALTRREFQVAVLEEQQRKNLLTP